MTANRVYFLISVALFLTGIGLSVYWFMHKPRAERAAPKEPAPLVRLTHAEIVDHPVTINALGTVVAAESVNLTPRISGMVQWISPNFIEGGLLKKGEVMVELDPTDFQLAIIQSENEVARAKYNLKLEQGQQRIVRREYQLLGSELKDLEQELVLRKPHLEAAKSALAAAEANLKQAQLNLERTRPFSPFNAIIVSRNANLGAWMSAFSTGTPLAKLVGIDNFWINVSVPVDKLNWINIPGINSRGGSKARISYEAAWGRGVYRYGTVKRLQAELEPEGRMAKIIVEVDDPLCQLPVSKGLPPLMLGTYVRVEISGNTLKNVAKISETLLHDDNQLWSINDKHSLGVNQVKPIWKENGYVFLSPDDIPNRDRIVASDLTAPHSGMQVRIEGQDKGQVDNNR